MFTRANGASVRVALALAVWLEFWKDTDTRQKRGEMNAAMLSAGVSSLKASCRSRSELRSWSKSRSGSPFATIASIAWARSGNWTMEYARAGPCSMSRWLARSGRFWGGSKDRSRSGVK
jgi:hypothetical protein